MSLLQVRPLGCRENLVALELHWRVAAEEVEPAPDIRALWTLWDPQGRPHKPYPEIPIERPMTGRELMAAQQLAWKDHADTTRRLYGATPLAGPFRTGAAIRGTLAFPVEIFSDQGRWTLVCQNGPRWYFSPTQLRGGLPRPVPPARNA